MMTAGSRDFIGYANDYPDVSWPDGKRLALSLVVNYEEGAEKAYPSGDATQEASTEWGRSPVPDGTRDLAMESMYEYGSRVGVWRILDVLKRHSAPATFFAAAKALEIHPAVGRAAVEQGHEICSHGLRWEEVFHLSRDEERAHIQEAVEIIERVTGSRPVGWYCRYGPSVHTRELVVEEGGFSYDSDAYNDDLPYFVDVHGADHLVIPYTADVNDMQWWMGSMVTGEEFFAYARESFDVLRREAQARPRMMSVGLHCRIIGRPGRIGGLDRFLAHASSYPDVWITTRARIADWWHTLRKDGAV
jgi:peptidoglycan/xylan/chitin deacetylase (PgdA/CDA1 family)